MKIASSTIRIAAAIAFAAVALPLLGQVAPAPSPPADLPGYRPQSKVNGVQIEEPMFEDRYAVLDALPDKAPARPMKPRKVFVLVPGTFANRLIALTESACNLRRAGIAEGVIMKIGGWRTRSVFERYAIVSQTDIADALRKLEDS